LRGESKEVVRDWIVFDLNTDQFLSEAEFLSIPSVGESPRGPIPDPIASMIDRLLNVAKKEADDEEQIQFNHDAFTESLSQGIDGQRLYGNADPNRDGVVNLAEARTFLEIQFGIRRPDTELLRFPDGRVVNHHLFLHADENKNGKLERDEFIQRSYGDDQVAAEFDKADADKNAILDLKEWCSIGGRCVIDLVLEFLRLDADLDGFVTPEEHLKRTAERNDAQLVSRPSVLENTERTHVVEIEASLSHRQHDRPEHTDNPTPHQGHHRCCERCYAAQDIGGKISPTTVASIPVIL
jgi:Ca2+-binding EF-hand superfamily protein